MDSTIKNPSIRFQFTSCCGAAICSQCTSAVFGKSRQSLQCTSCDNSALRVSCLHTRDIDAQRTDLGKRARENLRRRGYVRVRSDFRTSKAFNDYAEVLEDAVFTMVFDNGATQAAMDRLRAAIPTAFSLRNETGALRPLYMFTGAEQGPMPINSELQQLSSIGTAKHRAKDAEWAHIQALPMPCKRAAERSFVQKLDRECDQVKLAGGFDRSVHKLRNQQAAFGISFNR